MVCVTYTAGATTGQPPAPAPSNTGLIIGLALAALVGMVIFGRK